MIIGLENSYATGLYNFSEQSYNSMSEACAVVDAKVSEYLASNPPSSPYYIVDLSEDWSNQYGSNFHCEKTIESLDSGESLSDIPDNTVLYNAIYTDEQCQSQYGHATVLKGEFESPPYTTGACSLTPAAGTVGVCSFYDSAGNHAPDGQCYVTGDFTATSTGEVNTLDSGSNVESGGELSDAFTETTDPSTCSGGYVGSGGSYYCYSGDAADINVGAFDSAGNPITLDDQGAYDANGDPITVTDGAYDASGNPIEVGGGLSIGGGSWGDSGSGSGSGTDAGSGTDSGTGTDSGSTGDTETGTDLSGVLDAIGGVKASIQDGFQSLVDKLSKNQDDNIKQFQDGAPTQADYDAEFGSREDHQAAALGELNGMKGELTSLIDGSGSEFQTWYDTLGGYFGSYFPTLPEPSCSPLIFAEGSPYSFTIECELFERIRAALAWMLGLFTVWVVISTMFTARPS